MVRFSFSGHDLVALPQGALFWPGRRALLVADAGFPGAYCFEDVRAEGTTGTA